MTPMRPTAVRSAVRITIESCDMITGRHVLFGLLGGFAVILVANGAFVFFATTTFPGNEVDDPYRRGLAYNETLQADRDQRLDGWRATVVGSQMGIDIDLEVPTNLVASGFVLAGELRRPGRPDLDRYVVFERVAEGRYKSVIDLAPGRWEMQATATDAAGRELVRLRETFNILDH